MRFDNVSICSVAHVDAPERVTSSELERRLARPMKRLRIPQGLLEGLSGVRARRMWPRGTLPSDAAETAAAAVRLALGGRYVELGLGRRRVGGPGVGV